MALRKVDGTKVRRDTYYLNLRIPQAAQAEYRGKTHLRRSLKTADRREAERQVTLARAELIEAVERARQRANLGDAVAELPPEQRRLYEEAGGLEGLLKQYKSWQTALAFMEAGTPADAGDIDVDGGQVDYVRGDSFVVRKTGAAPVKVVTGAETDSEELRIELASHRGASAEIRALTNAHGKVLRQLGQNVNAPEVFGLRELLRAYVKAKGTGDQTAEAMGAVVGRFIELHGDLPLEELTIAHMREYAEAIEDLPAVTSSKRLRGQKLPDLLRIAKAEKLPPISAKTRGKHVAMLKALTAFAPGHGYMQADPWAAYKFIAPKGKHSAPKPRTAFTGEQVAAVLAEAAKYDAATIDHWAPLLAAYQGARREEIGQLCGADVFEREGVWCMRITDEGEGQKVKNSASFRTIPLHRAVIEAGFHTFAAGRPKDGYIFQEAERWGGKLNPMHTDERGRLTESYGKRFSRMRRLKLKISDPRLTFHSFRHTWEDAAENADMPQTHRRDLAGRSKAGDSQAAYGDGPKMAALKRSLDRVDPLSV